MKEINVEEIMAEIRADIKARGLVDDAPDFDSVIMSDVDFEYDKHVMIAQIDGMHRDYNVQWYKEIVGNKLKIFVKKVIRKMISFVIGPMNAEQVQFNFDTMNAVTQMASYIIECEEKIDELEKRIATIEEKK